MDGMSWTLWWCSQGELHAWTHTHTGWLHTYYKHACSECTCMNTQKWTHIMKHRLEVTGSLPCAVFKQNWAEGVCHVRLSVCVCVLVSDLPQLHCPNEWPHSEKGSSQITEQNCRQPAAWVVNKCHHNIHKEEWGTPGADTGWKAWGEDARKFTNAGCQVWTERQPDKWKETTEKFRIRRTTNDGRKISPLAKEKKKKTLGRLRFTHFAEQGQTMNPLETQEKAQMWPQFKKHKVEWPLWYFICMLTEKVKARVKVAEKWDSAWGMRQKIMSTQVSGDTW